MLLNNSAIDIYQGRLVGIQDHIRYGIWIQYKLLVCSVDAFPSWEFQCMLATVKVIPTFCE